MREIKELNHLDDLVWQQNVQFSGTDTDHNLQMVHKEAADVLHVGRKRGKT